MKKSIMVSAFLIFLLTLIAGCNQVDKTNNESDEKAKSVFDDKDKEKATEMIKTLEVNLELFEKETNVAISKGDIDIVDNEVFTQKVDEMSEKLVVQPFLEKYPESLISKRGDLKVTYTPESSDDCTFGNCNYDSIAVPTLQVNEKEWETYKSDEFDITELVFSDVKISYPNKQDSESTSISFVKGESGDLYFSFNPIIKSLNFNLKELDNEFSSIKSDVPESEVDAEEDEFKQEVEELLSNYPKLQ
ncbi:hypothetical protein [Paenisporosarcina sp. OV554]|uniref:hypothetical protein n=1 Tax=Paenisporosarcina sp. OV554 TaxID=2135694 RepID=UPI000D338C61|nr:hypothetical protein [Paenisporosarcina sp. OV554]PUB09469.1 hypothetical protein C8K15_13021 [Paenisporosarcina sp. OV554]